MLKIITKILFISIIVLLAACSAKYEKYYEFDVPKAQDGAKCVQICHETKTNCSKMCNNDTQLCQRNQLDHATIAYQSYIKERKVEGDVINRDLNSFYDPLQCSKVSCDCERDYRACYKMCGGKVITKQRCVENCPEKSNMMKPQFEF